MRSKALGKFDVHKSYKLMLVDKSIEFPAFFISGSGLENLVDNILTESSSDIEKALAIYDWMVKHIDYEEGGFYGERNAHEVFKAKQGICGEATYLYMLMARYAGLIANYVDVHIDHTGEKVDHACAGVMLDDKLVLVDIGIGQFDIKHKKYSVLDDSKVLWMHEHLRYVGEK